MNQSTLPRIGAACGAGIVLKLGSGAPELAAHAAHLTAGSQLHTAIDGIADGATVLSLYPSRRPGEARAGAAAVGSVAGLLPGDLHPP